MEPEAAAAAAADILSSISEESAESEQNKNKETEEPKVVEKEKVVVEKKKKLIMAKFHNDHKAYSGLPKGTKLHDNTTEQSAEDWCDRLEKVGNAAGWEEEIIFNNALLSMVPGSPADVWHKVKDKDELTTWKGFREALIDAFDPKATIMDRVEALQTTKLRRGERIDDYRRRIDLMFNTFKKAMAYMWKGPKYANYTAPQKEAMKVVTEDVYNFIKCMIFMQGLPKEFLPDITKSGLQELDEIQRIANRTPDAIGWVKVPGTTTANVSAVEDKGEVLLTAAAVQSMIAAAMEAARRTKAQAKKTKRARTARARKRRTLTCPR